MGVRLMGDPLISGELVVRNGKKRGSRITLTLPVTVIGQSDRSDVRLTGTGVGEVHCLITATAAGPTIRSWFPDQTLVNGTPTTASVLRDGDEIQVGPCLFQLSWFVDEVIPLTRAAVADPTSAKITAEDFAALRTQAAAVAAQHAMLTDTEWHLRDREDALHEQETQLAAVLEDRQRQLTGLLYTLASGREQLRQDRAKLAEESNGESARLRKMRDRVKPLYERAKRDRQRAKLLLGRLSEHLKRRWAEMERAAETQRAELERNRQQLDDATSRLLAEKARFAAESTMQQHRMREGWDLLKEGQRRLLADRQQSEESLGLRIAAVDARAADLEAREQALFTGRERVEARMQDLLEEVNRLEIRATRARVVLHELEQQRAIVEADLTAAASNGSGNTDQIFSMPNAIPLDRRAEGGVERMMSDLHEREREVAREKHALAVARSEFQRRVATISDERAVLAEQVAAITVARDRWQVAERDAAIELESIAKAVQAREFALLTRERELADADRKHRNRWSELEGFRLKLDAWQSSLTTHEVTAAAARDRAELELTGRAEYLDRWQNALGTLCRKWAELRKREKFALREELDRWAVSREQLEAKSVELDQLRDQLLTDAATVAEQTLALEQARQESTSARGDTAAKLMGTRRVRVLRKAWEAHFARVRRDIESRRTTLVAESTTAERRYRELHRTLAELAERRDDLVNAEQLSEVERFAKERVLDERAVVLSIESARAKRTEEALALVSGEVERVAAALMSSPMPPVLPSDELPPGVFALRAA